MLRSALLALSLLFAGLPLSAKPLLLNSQDTYVTACLGWNDTAERLVQICRNALLDSGISENHRVRVQEVLTWSLDAIGQEEQALALAMEMTEGASSNALSWETLGWMEFERDDFQRAKVAFEKSQSLGLGAYSVTGLAVSQYRLEEIDSEEVLERLNAALALKPDYEFALREKGYVLGDSGRYEESIAAFETAIAIDDQSTYNLYGHLWALSESGRWELALDAANRALEVDPDFYVALSRRSLVFLELRRSKMALKDAERLLQLRPEDSDGAVRKARAIFALGRRQNAIDYLNVWRKTVGDEHYIRYWLANFYFEDGRMRQAFDHIEVAVAEFGGDYFYHKLRGYIALQLEDYELAFDDAEHALSARNGDIWGLQLKASALMGMGQLDEALVVIEDADAAGLPRVEMRHFVRQLLDQNAYAKAIALRARYPETE